MDGPMSGVDPDVVDQDVGNFWRSLYKLEKNFDSVAAPKKIAGKVKISMIISKALKLSFISRNKILVIFAYSLRWGVNIYFKQKKEWVMSPYWYGFVYQGYGS